MRIRHSVLRVTFCLAVLSFLLMFKAASAGAGQGGAQEGIGVHGHWTIEVRNPDGALVSRREFENALAVPGRGYLAALLARTKASGEWTIVLTSPNQLVCLSNSIPAACLLAEPTSALNATGNVFKNLVIATNGVTVTVSGSATAGRNGTISAVSTTLTSCAYGTSCVGLPPASTQLTFKDLGNDAVTVQTGQQIQVTVEIGFSSAVP